MQAKPMAAGWRMDFLARVPAAVRHGLWPSLIREDGSCELDDFWEGWRYGLVKHGVQIEVAAKALLELGLEPPDHIGQMFGVFMQHVRAIWRSAEVAPDNTLKSAADASRDCRYCAGNGLAVRWRKEALKPGQAPSVTFYCLCPLGRAIKSNHRETAKDVAARIPDLADFARLQDERYAYPPHLWPPVPKLAADAPPRFAAMLARGLAVPADAEPEHEDAAMFRRPATAAY